MPWYAWVAIAALALGSALNVTGIGKPRRPITPGTALSVVIANGLLIWVIVSLAVDRG